MTNIVELRVNSCKNKAKTIFDKILSQKKKRNDKWKSRAFAVNAIMRLIVLFLCESLTHSLDNENINACVLKSLNKTNKIILKIYEVNVRSVIVVTYRNIPGCALAGIESLPSSYFRNICNLY